MNDTKRRPKPSLSTSQHAVIDLFAEFCSLILASELLPDQESSVAMASVFLAHVLKRSSSRPKHIHVCTTIASQLNVLLLSPSRHVTACIKLRRSLALFGLVAWCPLDSGDLRTVAVNPKRTRPRTGRVPQAPQNLVQNAQQSESSPLMCAGT